jgi:cystathionine beta-lyase family protein involved in aluminum resistance
MQHGYDTDTRISIGRIRIRQFSKKYDTRIHFTILKIKKIIMHIKTNNNRTLQST